MRPLPALFLALAVAAGLAAWMLRGEIAPTPPPEPPPPPAPEVEDLPPHLRLKTATLTIRVTSPDGAVPPHAEVGYLHRGRLRLLYAGADGTRQFADAPLDEVEVVARAPGFTEARTYRRLLAGVPEEVRLVLRPSSAPAPPAAPEAPTSDDDP